MTRVGRLVNTQLLVRRWLLVELANTRVAGKLPGDLAGALPLVQVLAGGGDDDGTFATPLVDLYFFAADVDGMWNLAAAGHEAMRRLAGADVGTERIDTVETVSLPAAVFYSSAVERAIATYRLHVTVA